ncbi:MAG: bifunctional (p)ppGpp synthetase/guanosine-3',5'-bis(diphosphate) 3'-pyrophosphohydrolase [Xanthomonadales bacterium]|nr:bifunctional (p)ppGpp synthetase/guanosine-3',5'-bis(diphosphate) 3'-pyrophosphohydrolase [Xanthomonadales bacterium]
MKRTGRQYATLDQWWAEYTAERGPEQLDTLEAAIRPLLSRSLALEPVEGVSSPEHLTETLAMLKELGIDPDTLAATCSYFQVRVGLTSGSTDPLVAQLVEIDKLEKAYDPDHSSKDPEGLRRLLLALVKDVRALLIALVDRTISLRAVASASEGQRQRYARRIAAIHAPLANRLGIWQLKWELEDLCFRYLHQDVYRRIARLLDETRTSRERYIDKLVAFLGSELEKAGVTADVAGRPKHIYSIWRKMQRKNLSFDQVFDIRAVRVLVDSVRDCYAALGLVHEHWQPIPGEFDDYIANPKPNGYRSLHTAVFGPQGKPVEIQVRTRQMHEDAELGVAAHWLYKEGGAHDPGFQRKLNSMRQLLGSEGDDEILEDFGAAPEEDEDRVYVMTPRGDVIDLRAGSTVLDFAYHVHTDVGHRCKGAKVNGRIVPLTYALRNGEQVQILTGREPEPSRDWMVPSLDYLKTPRARAKVRQWFKKVDFERNLADGKDTLERELRKLGVPLGNLKDVVERFNKQDLDGLYAAVGIGEVTPGQIANALTRDGHGHEEDRESVRVPLKPSPPRRTADGGDILIEGVGNLMTSMAKCCSPVPGDRIIGFLTRTRGVTIHREECPNVSRAIKADPQRLLQVDWAHTGAQQYEAEVALSGYDRPGLVRDIGNLMVNSKIELLGMNTNVDRGSGQVDVRLALRVTDFEQLSQILNRLGSLPNVFEARRIG